VKIRIFSQKVQEKSYLEAFQLKNSDNHNDQ